jgi:hypothetical protein
MDAAAISSSASASSPSPPPSASPEDVTTMCEAENNNSNSAHKNNNNNYLLEYSDLPKMICAYLSAEDALTFSMCCKTVKERTSFGFLHNIRLNTREDWGEDLVDLGIAETSSDDNNNNIILANPQFWMDLPLEKYTKTSNFHTLRFSCRWADQGWGDRKGKFFIIKHKIQKEGSSHQQDQKLPATSKEQPSSSTAAGVVSDSDPSNDNATNVTTGSTEDDAQDTTTGTNDPNTHGGIVVFETPEAAPHNPAGLQFEVTLDTLSSHEYKYSLWVLVGGGGGHELTIRDLFLTRVLVYDDSHQSLTKHHAALKNAGLYQSDNNPSSALCMKLLLHASKLAHAFERESTSMKRTATTAFASSGGGDGGDGESNFSLMGEAAHSLIQTLESAGFGKFGDEEEVQRLELLGRGIQEANDAMPRDQQDANNDRPTWMHGDRRVAHRLANNGNEGGARRRRLLMDMPADPFDAPLLDVDALANEHVQEQMQALGAHAWRMQALLQQHEQEEGQGP